MASTEIKPRGQAAAWADKLLREAHATKKSGLSPLARAQQEYVTVFEEDVRRFPSAYKASVRDNPGQWARNHIEGLDLAAVKQSTREQRAETKQTTQRTSVAHATKPQTERGARVLANLTRDGIDPAQVDEVRMLFRAGDSKRAMAIARDLGQNRAAKRGYGGPYHATKSALVDLIVIKSLNGVRRGSMTPEQFRTYMQSAFGSAKTAFLGDLVKRYNEGQSKLGYEDRAHWETTTTPKKRRQ